MTELSPQAQSVLDAFVDAACGSTYEMQHGVAAALRAAAYQVAPSRPSLDSCCEHWEQGIRHKLLAIAAELEGAQAEPPRRQVFPTPQQIAECGGPCEQGGPEACDCGLYERSASKSTL